MSSVLITLYGAISSSPILLSSCILIPSIDVSNSGLAHKDYKPEIRDSLPSQGGHGYNLVKDKIF
jgi:hypothetical protein